MAGGEEMVAEDEHAEENRAEDEGKNCPGDDVDLIIGRIFGAHLAEELAHAASRRNRTFAKFQKRILNRFPFKTISSIRSVVAVVPRYPLITNDLTEGEQLGMHFAATI